MRARAPPAWHAWPSPTAAGRAEPRAFPSRPPMPDSRVSEHVANIGKKRADYRTCADYQDEAKQHGKVVLLRGLPQPPAHALDVEEAFDHQRARQYPRNRQARQSDHGDQRVPEHMPQEHSAAVAPDRPRGANVIVAEAVDRCGSDVPGEGRE